MINYSSLDLTSALHSNSQKFLIYLSTTSVKLHCICNLLSKRAGILAKLETKWEDDGECKLMRKCTFSDPQYRRGYKRDDGLT